MKDYKDPQIVEEEVDCFDSLLLGIAIGYFVGILVWEMLGRVL